MSKSIDSLIEKRVKNILDKDILSDDDLKFLILYRSSQKVSPLDKLIGGFKKFMDVLNTPDNGDDE